MTTKDRPMGLNEAIDVVGFGKFQMLMFALLFPVEIFHGARMTSGYFFLLDIKHRCRIPGLENDTYDITSEEQQYLYNQTIPPSDSCHVYNSTLTDYNSPTDTSTSLTSCPDGFVYRQNVLSRNAVTQLDLVCGDADLVPQASMCLYLGALMGSTLVGMFSDRFGRRTGFLLSVSLLLPCGLGLPWVQRFALLIVLQLLVGAASSGMFSSAFVLVLEPVQPHLRKYPGLVTMMFFVVGELLLAASFYGLRDWRWVSIIITAPTVFFLSYLWLVPESLRWLMAKRRYSQVAENLLWMARWNGQVFPGSGGEKDEVPDLEELLKSYTEEQQFRTASLQREGVLDLFKSRVMCCRTLTICFTGSVLNMLYYGFIFNAAHLSGNQYVNFILSALVELPACLFTLLVVDRLGRRPVSCGFLLLGAVTSAGAVVVVLIGGNPWLLTLLAMLAKMGAAGLKGATFLWMSELFPTSVRSTGIGIASSCARLGAISAPYIVHYAHLISSQKMGSALPFIIFGVGAFLCFFLCLNLPETNGRDLPETVEQARRFGRVVDEEARSLKGASSVKYGSVDIGSYK